MTNHRTNLRAWTLILAPILALVLLAYAGSATYAHHPKPDPQPSHGQDCDSHGNNEDGNEDHCSPSLTPAESQSQEPSESEQPSESVAPSETPVESVVPSDTPTETVAPSQPVETPAPSQSLPNTAMLPMQGTDYMGVAILFVIIIAIGLGALMYFERLYRQGRL